MSHVHIMIFLYKKTIHTKVITLLHEKKKIHKLCPLKLYSASLSRQNKPCHGVRTYINNFTVGHVIYYDTLNILKTLNDLYEVVLRADWATYIYQIFTYIFWKIISLRYFNFKISFLGCFNKDVCVFIWGFSNK